jgi:transposase
MPRATRIKEWLSPEAMADWLRAASDKAGYQRRLAIHLTQNSRLHAEQVAEMLGVSKQAVWLWLGQYNRRGPAGLERVGRGGRRQALFTPIEEAEIVRKWASAAQDDAPSALKELRRQVELRLQRSVSAAYVYRLLARHGGWATVQRARAKGLAGPAISDFDRVARPWLKELK